MKKTLSIVAALLLLSSVAHAQTTVIAAQDSSSGARVNRVGSAADNAIRVVPGGSPVWLVSGTIQAAQSGIWTVAATQSGTWNIGTVTTVTGITNVVHVDDNGGVLTVDNGGTFAVQAGQSGTWTVQPGNTANTTAWLVTGTGGLFPAVQSGTWNIGTVTTLTGITNTVHVDDNSSSLTVDNGGTFAVQESGAGLTALQSIDAKLSSGITIGNGTASTTENNSVTAGQSNVALTVGLGYVYNGSAWVRPPTGAGNSSTSTPRVVLATDQATLPVSNAPCTPYHLSGGTAASDNSTLISSTARVLCDITPINTTSTIYFLKIYDTATAPTCSSATNLKHVFPIPHGTGAGGGLTRSLGSSGETYANGIGFCVVATGTDTASGSAATGVYIEGSYR